MPENRWGVKEIVCLIQLTIPNSDSPVKNDPCYEDNEERGPVLFTGYRNLARSLVSTLTSCDGGRFMRNG